MVKNSLNQYVIELKLIEMNNQEVYDMYKFTQYEHKYFDKTYDNDKLTNKNHFGIKNLEIWGLGLAYRNTIFDRAF